MSTIATMPRHEIISEIERMNRRMRPAHDFDSCGGMSTADWRRYKLLQDELQRIDSTPPGVCEHCGGTGVTDRGSDFIVCPYCEHGDLLPEPLEHAS